MLDLLKMLNKIKNTLLTFGEDRTLTMSLFPTAIRSLGHAIKVPKTCCTVIISSPTGNGIFALPSMSWAIDTLVLSPPSLTPWIVYSCPWTAGTSPIFSIAEWLTLLYSLHQIWLHNSCAHVLEQQGLHQSFPSQRCCAMI